MSIMAAPTEEDMAGSSEPLFLSFFARSMEGTQEPRDYSWNMFRHFETVPERASQNEQWYGRKTRDVFIRCLGEDEGSQFIETMLPFVQNYLKRCQRAGKTVSLDFEPAGRRAEFVAQINKLKEGLRPCFPVYPPPRQNTHLCTGG